MDAPRYVHDGPAVHLVAVARYGLVVQVLSDRVYHLYVFISNLNFNLRLFKKLVNGLDLTILRA